MALCHLLGPVLGDNLGSIHERSRLTAAERPSGVFSLPRRKIKRDLNFNNFVGLRSISKD